MPTLRLVADVGGTNARFALLDEADRPSLVRVLPCADYPELADAIRAYLADCGTPAIEEAAIAIANPVVGDRIAMTNHHWSFSISQLQAQLGLRQLHVVNDFTALALALPLFDEAELMQVGGETRDRRTPMALIGPGTGLGVSGLLPAAAGWQPIAGEGGHVSLAAADETEEQIIAILRRRYGHASAERALSGPGLMALYEAVVELKGGVPPRLTSASIVEQALAGSDPDCRAALDHFCAMLGSVAGNLALTLGASGGVFIGGGIVPRLGEHFLASPFRQRFENKGRFSAYLARIPCFVIQAEFPGLLGASRVFNSLIPESA